MPSIIETSDNLRDRITERLVTAIPDIEQRAYAEIIKLIEEFDISGGKLVPESQNKRKLLELQSRIEGVLKDAGYFKEVSQYLGSFSELTDDTIELHKTLNRIDPTKAPLTDIQRNYAEQALQTLNEGGLSTNFVQPVTQIINEALITGASIGDLEKSLNTYIIGNEEKVGRLRSYITVTARDTVTQLQGAQHTVIQQAYDMKYLRYVGGDIKDTRGQCIRWHKMEYLEIADLQSEIDLANKNQKVKLEMPKGHKWSGMIDGTTPTNFIVRRGGWNCRHQAIPVRRKK